ncbi:major facilitator superfamily domain-containing protein [Choanephora cucurbitarum]|nr:major facilitator superfamily domain-containing protein [Choanephora cucurbitarum]
MVKYLLPKVLYVCLYGVLGSAIPYLSLFYADVLHLPSQQIGIILAIAPFIQSLACPFWTYQVDRKPEWHGFLMAVLMLIGGFSVIGLMFIPLILQHEQTTILLATIVLAVTFAFFGQPVTVLVDSAVLKILGDDGIYYGNQRLWGSVSNGVCILLVGYLIGQFGINYAFYIFGISVIAFISTSLFTKITTHTRFYTIDPTNMNDANRVEHNQYISSNMQRMTSRASSHANTLLIEGGEHDLLNLQRTITSLAARDVQDEANLMLDQMNNLPPLGLALSHIPTVDTSLAVFANIVEEPELLEVGPSLKSTILSSPRVWTFLLMTLLFGVFYSMIAQFLFLFLKQDLKLDSSIIVTVAHLTIFLRNFVYEMLHPGQISTTIVALSLQLLNGFSYALIWSTCVSEVDRMFPASQRAVAQGILAALFSGLGFGLGCILGGFAYDHYGAIMLFNVSMAVSLISLLVFWSGRILCSN